MAGKCRMNGDVGGLAIPNLPDQNHVWILPNHGAQTIGKGKIDLGVHLHLTDAVHLVFDGILDGENIFVGRIDRAKSRIQCGGLTAAGGSGNQDDTVGKLKQSYHLRQGRGCETDLCQAEESAGLLRGAGARLARRRRWGERKPSRPPSARRS